MPQKKTAAAEMPPVHESADWFPLMAGQEFTDLVENIRQFGLREPIVMTVDGKLLDGRNRYRACLAAGVEPKFKTFRGPGKAFQYVISANLHRRHLTTSQRSMIAARIATLTQGARTDLAENSAMSQADAAEALKVSRGSVQNAKQVLDRGTPELVQAVRDGAVTVGAAIAAADLPPDEQRDVVRQVKKGVKASAAIPQKKQKQTKTKQTKQAKAPVPAPPMPPLPRIVEQLLDDLKMSVSHVEYEVELVLRLLREGIYNDEPVELTHDNYLALGGRLLDVFEALGALRDLVEKADDEVLEAQERH